MPVNVVMPQMGIEMTEGTVATWLKHEGDAVAIGEVIAAVETDKAIVELEADAGGTLLRIVAAAGVTVPVGAVIAYVGAPGEALPDAGTPREQHAARKARLEVPATGPGLRAGFPARRPGADGKIVLGRVSEAVARRTEATMRVTPHFHLTVRIDMTDAVALRSEVNGSAGRESRVSMNDLVIKACALALVKYPVYNSTFEGGHLQVAPHVNVGIAVALPEGLIVPAVLECERKSLVEIAHDSRDLARRGKEGKLKQAEYTGTFTVSNLGMFDVNAFTAIIVSPQVGVLALGSIEPAPVVRDGEVVVRQIMSATLSTDHRAAGGAEAAQFAGEIKRILEHPGELTD